MRGMTEAERQLRDELVDVTEKHNNAIESKADAAAIKAFGIRKAAIKDAIVALTATDTRSDNGRMMGRGNERQTGERALVGTNAPPEYRGEAGRAVAIRADQSLSQYYEQMPREITNPGGLDLGSFDRDAFWYQLCTRNVHGREFRALAEGTQSVSATGGGFITPIGFSASILELLRARLVFTSPGADGSINGPQVVDMRQNVEYVPTWSADAANTGQWVAENTQLTPGTPAIGYAQLVANMNASVVLASRQIVEDTNTAGGLADLIESQLAAAIARDLDTAALYGLGHTNSQPPGLFTSNVSGLLTTSMGTNGAALSSTYSSGGYAGTFGPFMAAINQVRNANDEPTGIYTNPSVAGYADSTLSTLNTYIDPPRMVQPFWPPYQSTAFSATEVQGSSSAASSALVCNTNRIIMGLRRGLEVMVLDQRWADFLQYGFVATVRLDWNFPYSTAMSRVEGILS